MTERCASKLVLILFGWIFFPFKPYLQLKVLHREASKQTQKLMYVKWSQIPPLNRKTFASPPFWPLKSEDHAILTYCLKHCYVSLDSAQIRPQPKSLCCNTQIIISFCKHHLRGLTRHCFGSRQHQQGHNTDSKLISQIRTWWCWHSHQEVFGMKNDSTKDKDKKNIVTLDRWIHYVIPRSTICTYLMELNTTMISMHTMVDWTKGPLLGHLTFRKLIKLVVMAPIKHCFNGQVQL